MTNEVIEKQARERAEKLEEKQTLGVYDNEENLARDTAWNDGKVSGYEEGFIDGAKWMQEHAIEWHDLRKCPYDLPMEEDLTIRCVLYNGNEVICKTDWYSLTEDEIGFGFGKTVIQFYCNDDWIDNNDVIAWCELPQFKD